jgi:hypothetical protein
LPKAALQSVTFFLEKAGSVNIFFPTSGTPVATGAVQVIVFDLQCANGHPFEGWFEDAGAFREQLQRELIACPVCNDTQVSRVPSTFAIRSSQSLPEKPAPKPAAEVLKVAEISHRVIEFIEKNFDDVGADFSKEALKIHYGVSEPRSIRGVSTQEEEKTLRSEGIEFFKLPLPVQSDQET